DSLLLPELRPMDQVGLAELHREITAARTAGVVHVLVRQAVRPPSRDLVSWLDSTLSDIGFRSLSSAWREISPPDAVSILRNILHRDLAYRAEIMPAWLAAELATRFCELFPETTRYFTNGTWDIGPSGQLEQPRSWCPLTEATFDAGIVAVTDGSI